MTWKQQASSNCPDCREPIIAETLLVRPVQNMIMAMQVRCPGRAKIDDDEANKRARVEGSEDVRCQRL